MIYRLRVNEVLKEKGVSQGLLSRGANIPPNLIARMVHDETYQPSYVTLKKVADYLGVTMDELVVTLPDKNI